MHLFIVHQFPDYDNFVSITVNLKKKTNCNFAIMNIFPIHNLKYYGFNSLLKKYEIQFIDVFKLNKKSILLKFLLSFLIILPKGIIKKLNRAWYYFYHNYTLFHKEDLVDLIKNKKIKTVNIDQSLPERYKQIFFLACKETGIKFISYKVGIEMRRNIKIKIEDYNLFNYTIMQDENLILDDTEENRKKFIRISNPRYSLDWLEEVENSYRYKLKEYNLDTNKKKLKVLIVTRPMFSNKSWQVIYEELKKIRNIEVRIKLKPRGQFRPLHVQENIINEYNTSELINWADVIVAHSTSVLIEGIIKDKKILFLNFLFDLEKINETKYIFENQNIVEYMYSKVDLIKRIESLKENKKDNVDYKEYQKSKKFFLEKSLGNNFFDKKNSLKKKFVDIYLN